MQGLEISKKYYEEYGKKAIHENFPELEGVIAVGLCGSGSECFGYDDEVSRDHDFEPGFCIFIPEEDVVDAKTAFKLERMYAKLPKEFMGLKRNTLNPAGGNRHGVMRFSEFFERHLGKKDNNLSINDWFNIPEHDLLEVINGEIWKDDTGIFTKMREAIRNMPEDIRLKKIAGSLYLMGQSGIYNYERCVAHHEKGAAQLALAEYVKHTMHVAFLLNREYMPYYKWSFRALSKLPLLNELKDKLEYLLNTGNEAVDVEKKKNVIVECNNLVIDTLKKLELTNQNCNDLGNHAFSVNDKIKDNYLRNTNILAGVTSF